MTDHPVIMSAPMVNATLREVREPGTGKRETRRLAFRPAREGEATGEGSLLSYEIPSGSAVGKITSHQRPTGWHARKPGDRLWVREAWKPHSIYSGMKPRDMPQSKVFYLADGKYEPSNVAGVPSIHMPRWASRLTLHVTGVRIERLQNISQDAARAEGVEPSEEYPNLYRLYSPLPGNAPGLAVTAFPKNSFWSLWQSLHGPESWDANPWVVVVQFRPVLANIDSPEAKAA